MQASSRGIAPTSIDPPRLQRAWERGLIVIFLLAISVPGLATIAGVDRDVTEGENRQLAPFPALGLDVPTLRALPDGFTRYFEDHFAFRARLVEWQARVRLELLGASPSASVLVGREKWLFYADDGSIQDYTGVPPFSDQDLEVWRQTLQHTQDWLERHGIAYLFVIAPDKYVIYPELMPAGVRRLSDESRVDRLVQHLATHSTVHVLDLRHALEDAKAHERLYHRTDTHWNDRGAFVAYEQIARRLHTSLPSVRPLPRTAFDANVQMKTGRDLAKMVGLGDGLIEEELTLVPHAAPCARTVELHEPLSAPARVVTECATPGLPRAVVFRDSFASAFMSFLSEHFSRALYLWEPDVDPRVVTTERPDVVIHEWVSRHLNTQMPYDAVAGMKSAAPRPGSGRPEPSAVVRGTTGVSTKDARAFSSSREVRRGARTVGEAPHR